MNIHLVGVLLDPLGSPLPNTKIRFTALETAEDITECAEAIFTSNGLGAYDFLLTYGRYLLEVNYDDEYCLLGEVIADSATPTPLDLTSLIEYTTPVEPPVIVPETPIWQDLHDDLRNGLDTTERTKIDQLSDNQTYTNETKRLIQNEVLAAEMSEESVMTQVGSAGVDDQTNVYEDANNHQSIQKTSTGTTARGSFELGTELYEASNGIVELYSTLAFNNPVGSYESVTELGENTVGSLTAFTRDNGTYLHSNTLSDTTYTSDKELSINVGTRIVSTAHNDTLDTEYTDTLGNPLTEPRVVSEFTTTLDRADQVHHTAVINRIQSARVDAADELQATQELSITANGKEMGVYQYFSGITQTQIIKSDLTSFVGSDGVELVELDAINNVMTVRGRLVVTNPEDFQGTPGSSTYFEYQYSQDNGVTNPWHEVPDYNVDLWRRQREVYDLNDGTPPTYGDWTEGFLLNAQDGLPGDTYWIEYNYGAGSETTPPSPLDPSWTETMETGDIWRRERIVDNGIAGSWSVPARIRGLNGADPEVVMLEYQYAIDGLSGSAEWHYNFSTGDFYRRERTLYFYTAEDLHNYVPVSNNTYYFATPWANVGQIAPIDGVDYGYKHANVLLYQKQTSTTVPPDAPRGDIKYNFITLAITEDDPAAFNGWSPTVPAGTDSMWVAVASVWSLTDEDIIPNTEWVIELMSPVGKDGATGVYTSYIYKNAATPPTDNPAGGSYDGVTEIVPVGYTDDPQSPNNGEFTYVRVGKYIHDPDTNTWSIDDSFYTSGWTPSSQFSGDAGLDGDYNSYVYRNAENPPLDIDTDPAVTNKGSYDGNAEVVPTLWTDDPVTPVAPEVTWVSKSRYFQNNAGIWARANGWSTPSKWTGSDAWSVATVILYRVATTQPAVPNNPITYTFEDGVLTGSLDGWSSTVPDNTLEGGKVWVTFNTALSQGASDVLDAVNWSVPTVMSQNGLDGVGVPGDHGSGSYLFLGATASAASIRGFSDAQHTGYFTGIAGRPPQNNDVFGYVSAASLGEENQYRVDFEYDNGVWTEFVSVINGSQIVHGSVFAYHLGAHTITGDEIYAYSNIIVGDGNNTAGMNGSNEVGYAGWRFWSGGLTPAAANFKVDDDGNLFAESGRFRGAVQMIGTGFMTLTSATPFGSANQFLEWTGTASVDGNGDPIMSNVTEGNAIKYLKSNGAAYFGGSLSAGIFRNAATNTSLTKYTLNVPAIEIGAFTTNGGSKSVVISYNLRGSYTDAGTCPVPNNPSVSWRLERKIGTGGWISLTTGTFTGTIDCFEELGDYFLHEDASASTTYTDTNTSTEPFSYRVIVTAQARYLATSNVYTQTLSLISTEE